MNRNSHCHIVILCSHLPCEQNLNDTSLHLQRVEEIALAFKGSGQRGTKRGTHKFSLEGRKKIHSPVKWGVRWSVCLLQKHQIQSSLSMADQDLTKHFSTFDQKD